MILIYIKLSLLCCYLPCLFREHTLYFCSTSLQRQILLCLYELKDFSWVFLLFPCWIPTKTLPDFHPICQIWPSCCDTAPFCLFAGCCLLINTGDSSEPPQLLRGWQGFWSTFLIPGNVMIKFSSAQISVLSLGLPYLYKHFMFFLSQCLQVSNSFMHFFATSIFNLDPS